MQEEYTFKGVQLKPRVRKAVKSCAHDLEKKIPDLSKVHFSVKKSEKKGGHYSIDLRVVSKATDVVSTVETDNLFRGLRVIKNATVMKIRESKKKLIHNSRKKTKRNQLNFLLGDYDFKEAL